MSALVLSASSKSKLGCNGRLYFELVGIVGPGLLVLTGIGNGTPSHRFFPPSVI